MMVGVEKTVAQACTGFRSAGVSPALLTFAGQDARLKAAATKAKCWTEARRYKGAGIRAPTAEDDDMKLLLRHGSAMRSLSFGVALLALVAFATGAARAQQITTTKVIFFVTDPSGAAIGNATIVLGMPSNTPGTKTDEYGRLSVDLPIGAQYNFPVSAPGYISDYIYIDLTSAEFPASDTKNVIVVLHPADRD